MSAVDSRILTQTHTNQAFRGLAVKKRCYRRGKEHGHTRSRELAPQDGLRKPSVVKAEMTEATVDRDPLRQTLLGAGTIVCFPPAVTAKNPTGSDWPPNAPCLHLLDGRTRASFLTGPEVKLSKQNKKKGKGIMPKVFLLMTRQRHRKTDTISGRKRINKPRALPTSPSQKL